MSRLIGRLRGSGLFAALALTCAWGALSASAQVVINEIVAANSDRLLQYTSSYPQLGITTPWYAAAYDDAPWKTGNGPFGFGTFTNISSFGVNTSSAMLNKTPSLYVRKAFNVTTAQAASTNQLQLITRFNDGFIAFLNGVEIARRNMGNTNMFAYRDQTAFNTNALPCPSMTIDLGSASNRLSVGTNTLCIQTHNQLVSSANLLCMADLRLEGTTPASLVTNNAAWKYFVGVAEPSGGVIDYGILNGVPETAVWATLGFSDASWPEGSGPFGMDVGATPDYALGVNLYDQLYGKASSLYTRTIFTASSADAASTLPLQLTLDYDDGIVVYINGREVVRRNVGVTNTITAFDALSISNHNTLGDNGGVVTGGVETVLIAAASNLLAAGNNVLAVQLHNSATTNDDLIARVTLSTTGPGAHALASPSDAGRYFVGTQEPTDSSGGDDDSETSYELDTPDSENDWVELYNAGSDPVNLTGWSLTDNSNDPRKWYFPAGSSIPAKGYLVVMCTGYNVGPANGATYLHTNFKLGSGGEYLALVDTSGAIASELSPGFPAQSHFHSYARTAEGQFAFFDTATPGAANTGKTYSAICSPPSFSNVGGFYSTTFQLQVTATNADEVVRYTLNGCEPCSTDALFSAALTINTNTVVRARTFKTNAVPSIVCTHTYLFAQSAARRSIAALCLAADPVHGIYGPNANGGPANGDGILAIKGGAYTNTGNQTIWYNKGDMAAFNMPAIYGRSAERPACFEYYPTNGSPLRTDLGLRVSSSGWSRPQLVLTDKPSSRFTYSDSKQKPSFNIFFRGELGDSPQDYPFFAQSKVTVFEDLRIRAGKNDIQNPFIADEFMRRLFIGTGQQGSMGTFASVYINGVWKGYFNFCEHLREGFMQQHHNSSASWDVQQVNAFASGDAVNWNASIAFIRTNNLTVAANYVRALSYFDTTNVADYLTVNTFAAQGDWPNNNWVAARERSDAGRWRFYMWDAEMSFSLSTGRALSYNSFTSDLIRADAKTTTSYYIPAVFTLFYAAPEFRLLFADRVQKHFFNDGCMTRTNMLAVYYQLRNTANPIIKETTGSYITETAYTNWVVADTRRTNYFVQLSQLGLWPTNAAPVFSVYGGTLTAGTAVSITNINPTGNIYFTTNGTDPRAVGGAAVGALYTAPLVFNATGTLKARVLGASGEWSPLQEAAYSVPVDVPAFLPAGSADWTSDANWNSAPLKYPNGTNVSVSIGAPVGADRNVNLRAPVTVGSITFVQNDTAFCNKLRDRSTGNTLTFQATNGPAALTVNGTGTGYVELEVAADAILASTLRLEVNNTAGSGDYGALRLRANWRGAGGLTKEGDGVASLTGDSKSYTGATAINRGVLALTESASPFQSAVSVAPGGQLRLTSASTGGVPRNYRFGALTLNSGGRGGSLPPSGQGVSGGLRYQPDTDDSVAVVSNDIAVAGLSAIHVENARNALECAGVLSGAGGLVKTGGGNLILSGKSTRYSAPVTVSNGTVTVSGRLLSPVQVAAGASLAGSGRVGPVAGGGTVALNGQVLRAASAEGLNFAFLFGSKGPPAYGASGASGNGVLRVLAIEPAETAPVIDIFLCATNLVENDTLRGGIFVEGTFGLAAFLQSCTVNFLVPDAAGTRTFGGQTYSSYAGDYALTATAMPETADFGDGPRVGEVMEIRVAGAPVSYAQWALQAALAATGPLATPALPSPHADPSASGVDSLLRYALNLGLCDNPSCRMPKLSVCAEDSPRYSFYLDPGKLDLVYRVEASSDLTDWSRVLFDSRARDFTGWSNGWLTICDPAAAEAKAPQQFYRLRVILNDD